MAALLVWSSAARAAAPVSQQYSYTGAEQVFTVPQGIAALHFQATGGDGSGGNPGLGGSVEGDLPVSAGESLYLEVGGGGPTNGNRWNGSGPGDCVHVTFQCEASGGDATDIRMISRMQTGSLQSRVAVAGGGGGGGIACSGILCLFCHAPSCTSGGSAGSDGNPTPFAGSAGTTSAGGAGGTDPDQYCLQSNPGSTAETYAAAGSGGSLGQGGGGARNEGFLFPFDVGGGGGGGYYGGGGGATCTADNGTSRYGPGGGGSNYLAPSVAHGTIGPDYNHTPLITLTAPVPANTAPPTLSGGIDVGTTLTEGAAKWAGGATKYSYQWDRCAANSAPDSCVAIPGATENTYVLTIADDGSTLRVGEAAANGYGLSDFTLSSNASGLIGEAPTNSAAPSVGGSPVEGQTLVEHEGTWTDSPASYTYVWQRCDAAGSRCTAIPGATMTSYQLTAADTGATIRVEETAANNYGTGTPSQSLATAVVEDAPINLQGTSLVGTARALIAGTVATLTDPADPGAPASDYSATINWGDGTHTTGRVRTGAGGLYLIAGRHAYASSGIFTITITAEATHGATATTTNRVTVLPATICTGHAHHGKTCLGQIQLPKGCLLQQTSLPINMKGLSQVRNVIYTLDHGHKQIPSRGANYSAHLALKHIAQGMHTVTAHITYKSGRPPTGTITSGFDVC
jgi:hypothetical protein